MADNAFGVMAPCCLKGCLYGVIMAWISSVTLTSPIARSSGPRGVGKSYLLRRKLADPVVFDLLDTRLQLELTRAPHELEARIGALRAGPWVWLDEVQKVPALARGHVLRRRPTRGVGERPYRFQLVRCQKTMYIY